MMVDKIISGGQVGADRAGLDFAIEHHIEHGGWCPKYRRAADGLVPLRFRLQESPHPGYPDRTKRNVREADGTVVFTTEPPGRGSAMTIQSCLDFGRPYLVLTGELSLDEASMRLIQFIRRNRIKVLNVAGSRSQDIGQRTKLTLGLALLTWMERWAEPEE